MKVLIARKLAFDALRQQAPIDSIPVALMLVKADNLADDPDGVDVPVPFEASWLWHPMTRDRRMRPALIAALRELLTELEGEEAAHGRT